MKKHRAIEQAFEFLSDNAKGFCGSKSKAMDLEVFLALNLFKLYQCSIKVFRMDE